MTAKSPAAKSPLRKKPGTKTPDTRTPRAKALRAKQPIAKRPAAQAGTTRAPRAKAPKPSSRRVPTGRAPVRKGPVRKPSARKPSHPRSVPTQPRVRTVISSPRRLIALLVLMAIALGVILVRLVDVQGVEGHHYEAMALAQRVHSVTLAAERGSIFDRNGNDLALSVPQQTVYADPRVVKDAARYARKLAPVVHVNEWKLRQRLAQRKTAFVYVARKVSDHTAARVKQLHLPGVGFVPESKRFYPGGSLAGPVLGFVGTDNNGLGGLEARDESTLRGKPGRLVAEEDPDGREIPSTQRVDDPAHRGGDLVLTLDESLQYEVEKQLVAQVNRVSARGGMAIIADVKTGDVLAMASVDGPSGGQPARVSPATETNHPLTTVYEPGSTAKVVTVAGALETGVVQPTTRFTVPWSLPIADRVFKDAEQHADQDWSVGDIVRQSSNVGVIKIAAKLGKERLDHYQRAFGFGTKTAINFSGESAGLMKNVADYVPADMGSIPIGYTTAVTPMQMLDVFTTIANGGVSRPPRLLAARISADGTRSDIPAPRGRRIVSEKTAAEVNAMLRDVVRDGTGEKAAISGYTVAGKTGTSRKPPYEPTPRYMASFAGFAPAEAPRLAAIVVIDQPGTDNEQYFGGQVAAPLFSTIMQYALRLERVAPTTILAGVPTSAGPVEPARTTSATTTATTTTTTAPPPGATTVAAAPAPTSADPASNVVKPVP